MLRSSYIDQQNHDYQRDLAKLLLAKLGYAEAVQACYENQWHGVLYALDQENKNHH